MAIPNDNVMSQVRKALAVLGRHAEVAGALLFGSQVEGRAHADSDIDLAVFVDGAEAWGFQERADLAVLVAREAGDYVELHFFPASDLEHADPASFAAYILEHGVRIEDAAVGRVAEDKAKYGTHKTGA